MSGTTHHTGDAFLSLARINVGEGKPRGRSRFLAIFPRGAGEGPDRVRSHAKRRYGTLLFDVKLNLLSVGPSPKPSPGQRERAQT